MKNNIQKILALAIFVLVFSAGTTFAQIRTGGYKKISVTDAQAIAAAEFAVSFQSEAEELEISLDSITKAERQVVAGVNFRLCLTVFVTETDESVEEQFVQAIVFRNLKNVYSLKSWTETESCDE